MDFPKTSQHDSLALAMSDGPTLNNQISAAPAATNELRSREVSTGTYPKGDSLHLSRAQSAQDIVCADELPVELAEAEVTMVFPEEPPTDMSAQDAQGKLLLAARHGDAATAKAMVLRLGSPCEINRCHELGETPLLLAVRNQHTETVKVFTQMLGTLKDLNVFDAVGSTPLIIATKNCDIQTARVLVDAGAAIHTKDPLGFNAIMKAAEQRADLPHDLLIELLIERQMDSEQIRELA